MKLKLRAKILSCLLIIFFSNHVLATFNSYLEELDGKSEYTMSERTKKRLVSRYKDDDTYAIGNNALEQKHYDFTLNKKALIDEWEKYTKQTWPTYTYETANREYGDKFDAHHIIPQSYNGPNEWWNLFPLTNYKHHRIHTNGTNCSQLFPNSRGNGRESEEYLK